MDKIYIFGHKFPDTDSITSAIALEYLKKEQGVFCEARSLGELNDESKYILDRFNIKPPKYLNDVKLQIRDINYHKDIFINEKASILDAYNYMNEQNVTGIPVVDDYNNFLNIVTAKTLLTSLVDVDDNKINTSYDNIKKTLNAEVILKFDDEIKGNVTAVAFRSTTFLENYDITDNDILIVGDRHSIIEKAVKDKARLIIITGSNYIKEEHIEIARKNKVNILRTDYNTFKTTRRIMFSNYINTLFNIKRPIVLLERDYYDEFMEKTKSFGYNNYPVVDRRGMCKGLFRLTDSNHKNKKKVILVDHNESSQSANGLDEAEILEVIDHHKIGDISTNNPINFRNMTVGSCNTIIYHMFEENRVEIPKDIASIMLGGIISDTLALTSPTTTEYDKYVVTKLEKISSLKLEEYAYDIFNASSKLDEKTPLELIDLDTKTFHYDNNRTFRISQVALMDATNILAMKEDIIKELNNIRDNKDYDFIIFAVTDISHKGSFILYSETGNSIKYLSMRFKDLEQGMFMDGVMSRKKQLVPLIMEVE